MPIIQPIGINAYRKNLSWWKRWLTYIFPYRDWKIIEDYYLYIPFLKVYLKIPKGFIFDGASIPKIFWPFLSPTGILFLASLFHDFGYRNKYLLFDNGTKLYVDVLDKQKCFDKLFYDIAKWENSIDVPKIIIIYRLILIFIAYQILRMVGKIAYKARKTNTN